MNCDILNIVGLAMIEFVPIRGISSFQIFRKTDGSMGGSVALQAGYAWEKLSERYAEPDKRYWEENVTLNTAQGNIYDNRLVDILPGIDGVSQFELDDNQRNSFIVRFEDQTGRKFIVGSPQFPLKFKASYNSSRGFYQTEFTGRQLHRALIWNY